MRRAGRALSLFFSRPQRPLPCGSPLPHPTPPRTRTPHPSPPPAWLARPLLSSSRGLQQSWASPRMCRCVAREGEGKKIGRRRAEGGGVRLARVRTPAHDHAAPIHAADPPMTEACMLGLYVGGVVRRNGVGGHARRRAAHMRSSAPRAHRGGPPSSPSPRAPRPLARGRCRVWPPRPPTRRPRARHHSRRARRDA